MLFRERNVNKPYWPSEVLGSSHALPNKIFGRGPGIFLNSANEWYFTRTVIAPSTKTAKREVTNTAVKKISIVYLKRVDRFHELAELTTLNDHLCRFDFSSDIPYSREMCAIVLPKSSGRSTNFFRVTSSFLLLQWLPCPTLPQDFSCNKPTSFSPGRGALGMNLEFFELKVWNGWNGTGWSPNSETAKRIRWHPRRPRGS